MTHDVAAEHALRRLWELIDSQRWDRLGEVLDCVTHTRVSDGKETYHVASFALVRDGVIAEMDELWSDTDAEPPADRRP